MRRDYDFWLLDLDGTLVDVETSYIHEVGTQVGNRLGVSFSARQAEHLWYGFGDTREQVFAETGVDRNRFWDVFHAVDDPEPRAAATHVYPDATDFVTELSGPVGLVTHCQEFLTKPILAAVGIADWFDTVVCCDEDIGWKPDPEPLERAMSELGVTGSGYAGAMVGDDPRDVDAAHNAGLDAVHVRRHDSERLGGEVNGARQVDGLGAVLDG